MSASATSATSGSTGTPAAGTPRAGHAAGHRAGASNAGGGSAVFSNLLDLLSATSGETVLDPLAATSDPQQGLGSTAGKRGRHAKAGDDTLAAASPPEGGDNPLANLLAWSGPAAALSGTSASGSTSAGTPGAGKAAAEAVSAAAVSATGMEIAPDSTASTAATSPAIATASDGNGNGAPLPAGMTLLDQPVEADAQTLAAVRGAASDEAAATPAQTVRAEATSASAADALQAGATSKNTSPGTMPPNAAANWRSTAGMGQVSAVQQMHVQHAAQINAQANVQAPVDARAATVRSTVALDERFGTTTTTPTTTALESTRNPASHPSTGTPTDGGAGQPGPGGDPSTPAPADKPLTENDTASAFDLRSGDDPATEGGAWNTHGLRHASLRVGEKGEEAIDIRLSMAGDALNVDFRTDHADIRSSLQQHAGDSLSDMLQRSGIQLGDVSVGAQHPGQGQGQHPSGQPAAPDVRAVPGSRTDATGTAPQAPPRAPQRPRSDGSRPVDLFV